MNIFKRLFQIWHQKPYSSRFTKKQAKAIADEHGLKKEVIKTMRNGCTPDEALLFWDIYPHSGWTQKSPVSQSLIEKTINENPQGALLNIAVNNPEIYIDIFTEYESRFRFKVNCCIILNEERKKIARQCDSLNHASINDLIKLSQLLFKAHDHRSEKVFLLNQMISDWGLNESSINRIISNLDEKLTRRMAVDIVLLDYPNFQIEDVKKEIEDIIRRTEYVISCSHTFFYEKLEWLIHNETDTLFTELIWTARHENQAAQNKVVVKEKKLEREGYVDITDPESFINKYVAAREEKAPIHTKEIESILKNRFGPDAMTAIHYLLDRCDDKTLRDFAYACLPPEDLASKATVDIVVKRIGDIGKSRGNTGLYLIYTQKEHGGLHRLKFTHQASCVYYLMFLIDRYKSSHGSNRPSLKENKEFFIELYSKVYDIPQACIKGRFDNLLRRKDKHGEMRAGREKEIIYDIKMQVRNAFEYYDESYYPYIMTAEKHISVSRERIHFVDEACKLLLLSDKSAK